MSDAMRKVEGTVLRLRCDVCGSSFAHFVFSGEDDLETAGLCSASSCVQDEIVITQTDAREWRDLADGDVASVERRLARELARDDLKVIAVRRVEDHANEAAGMSFAEFRKVYRPPTLIYSCACCAQGESRMVEEITVSAFREGGGRVSLGAGLIE